MVLLSRTLQQLKHKASTVAIGRAYELLAIEVLRSHSFQLTHRGRPGDKGIDFWGTWVLPSLELAVAGQCKCLKTPLRSAHVREFEGTVAALRRSSRGQWLGVLVSRQGFSVSAVQAFRLSLYPMLACHLVPKSTTEEQSIDSAEETLQDMALCVSSGDSTEVTARGELCSEPPAASYGDSSSEPPAASYGDSSSEPPAASYGDSSSEPPAASYGDSSSEHGCAGGWKQIKSSSLSQRATGKDQLRQVSLTPEQQGTASSGPAPNGRIANLLINDTAQRELPNFSIATKQLANVNVNQSGVTSDDVVLLYRTATDGVTWVLGDVQQRMPPSGKPLQWGMWTE